MAKKKSSMVRYPSIKAEDQPATRKMLSLVRDEIKADIRSLNQKIDGHDTKFRSLDTKVQSLDTKVEALCTKVENIDSKISGLRADFQKLEAGNFRMQLLLEEQNANNRIVLDGLQALWHRQDRLEQRHT